MTPPRDEAIAVIGLGYVGLPVALAFARRFPTVGYDLDEPRVAELRAGRDQTGSATREQLEQSALRLTSEARDLGTSTFFVVTVPAPLAADQQLDLEPLVRASETVGAALRPGAVVVYESTVPPGTTQELCGPVLERASGLRRGSDFSLGYSPERINPGDRAHSFERVVKVVAAEEAGALDRISAAYEAVIDAGVVKAASIAVAEAAKVIENAQRDVNIALMNEAAHIFARLGIRTRDVLDVAATKWNFLPFEPGLVGGHCIGLGSQCLASAARDHHLDPELLVAARRVNDRVGEQVARRTMALLAESQVELDQARVGICGLTFKENVPDLRNSRVPEIVAVLQQAGIRPLVHDPVCDPHRARTEYGLELSSWSELSELDALICAVPHSFYRAMAPADLLSRVRDDGIVIDVKSMLDPAQVDRSLHYWSL